MSRTTRVRWNSSTGGSLGVSLYLNRFWAMVRNVRPRVSKCAIVGVLACTDAFAARVSAPVWASPDASADRIRWHTRSASSRPRAAGGRNRRRPGRPSDRDQDRVIHVPGLLPPGVEDHLLPGVVGMERRDHAVHRVVEQDRADADVARRARMRACALKNGSYCRTGLPLLLKTVQPLPTQRGEGWISGPPSPSRRTGPGSAWIFFWISRPKPSE